MSGPPFSAPANRNVLVLLCSGSVGWVDSTAGVVIVEGAGLQGGVARTASSFDLSYRAA